MKERYVALRELHKLALLKIQLQKGERPKEIEKMLVGLGELDEVLFNFVIDNRGVLDRNLVNYVGIDNAEIIKDLDVVARTYQKILESEY